MCEKLIAAARAKIELLTKQKNEYAKKADAAYHNSDLKLELKLQKEINTKNNEIEQLETRIIEIEYPELDIEKLISERRREHDWSNGERCTGCAMKQSTTFTWKETGVRENYRDGFKSESVKILDTMKCKKRFK